MTHTHSKRQLAALPAYEPQAYESCISGGSIHGPTLSPANSNADAPRLATRCELRDPPRGHYRLQAPTE